MIAVKRGSIAYGPCREWHVVTSIGNNILKPTGVNTVFRAVYRRGRGRRIRRSHRVPSVYAASIYRDVTKIALTPPPRHITLPSSPRATLPRYLSSHLLPLSRSSSKTFSHLLSPSPFILRSISDDASRHQNLSLSLPLSSVYLTIYLSASRNFSLQESTGHPKRRDQKMKKITRGSRFPFLLLRFFYDSTIRSTNQSPHQEPPTTSPPSSRLTHSNKFLLLLLLPLLFPFTSHTFLLSAPSNNRRQECANQENREHCCYVHKQERRVCRVRERHTRCAGASVPHETAEIVLLLSLSLD